MGKRVVCSLAGSVALAASLMLVTTGLTARMLSPAATTGPISVGELGDRLAAEAREQGDLTVATTAQGAELRSRMQHLLGVVGPDGLRVTSTAPGTESAVPLRLTADRLGRVDMPGESLPRTGTVQRAGELVRYVRPGVVEEFSVSADGIRQDFLVATPPAGEGELRLELALSGATALRSQADGVLLSLAKSGRELVYHRLHVTDANGTVLPAAMHRLGPARLAIDVDDRGAAWPLRIDPTITDADWVGFGGPPGVGSNNVLVDAIAVAGNGNVILGGSFNTVGDTLANKVARWDGNAWTDLGGGAFDPRDRIYALALDGGDLYVGGSFTNVNGLLDGDFVLRFDGISWHAVGSGLDGLVRTLAVDPSSGQLYAGGDFTGHLAAFSSGSWSTIAGLNGDVYALVFNGAGDLCVGGDFTDAGGIAAADNIALYNKGVWSALGAGLNDRVSALTYAPANDDIYVGGRFTNAGGVADADYLAVWTTTGWDDVGGGSTGEVNALLFDSKKQLHVGGALFAVTADPTMKDYAIFTGTEWVDGGLVETFASAKGFAEVSPGRVWLGGNFRIGENGPIAGVAVWDNGLEPIPGVPIGFSGEIEDVLVDSQGDLLIGGQFTDAFGVAAADNLARWDGNTWSGVGGGVEGRVYALAEDSLGNLYVGGGNQGFGGDPAITNFARWDGISWSSLGSFTLDVRDIVFDAQDRFYVGGAFLSIAGVTGASRVAYWNGATWEGLDSGLNGTVFSLALADNGDLYAGGFFTATDSGQSLSYIARWDGTSWYDLGGGMDEPVEDLALDGTDRLVAVGRFDNAGGVATSARVARWDGVSWSAIGSSAISRDVYAVAITSDETIYIGGLFSGGGTPGEYVAMFNGSSWQPLGSGVDGAVRVVHFDATDQALYFGGVFAVAGGQPSAGIAQVLLPLADIKPKFDNDVDEDGNSDTVFAAGSEGSPLSLDALLAVTDGNRNETLTWTVTAAPAHGTLAGFPTTASTNGASVVPTGLTYEADAKYIGTDAFIVAVTDGTHTGEMKVDIAVSSLNPPGTLTASVTSGLVTLNWDDRSSSETGYRVERRLLGGSWAEIAQLPANTQFYDDAPPGGATYEYRVRAVKE